jgi:hypothetical protein
MILLLHKEGLGQKYVLMETFETPEDVFLVKGDTNSCYFLNKNGYRVLTLSRISITKSRIHSLDDSDSYITYLDESRHTEFFHNDEAMEAWSAYRESKIDAVLNKDLLT